MRRILLVVSCLTVGACAGIKFSGTTLDSAALQPPGEPQPPEGKKLADFAKQAFDTAKLTGPPEVSPARATHDNQWGDWMFCVKSAAEASPKYAVLIGHDAILEVRTSVFIDGCDRETYSALVDPEPPGKTGPHK